MMQEGVDPTGYQKYIRGIPFRYNCSNSGPPHHCSAAQMEFGTGKGKGRGARRCDSNWIGHERGNGTRRILNPVPDWGGATEARLDAVTARWSFY